MNRRRFLKYVGATTAVIGATVLGFDQFLSPNLPPSQQSLTSTSNLTSVASSTSTTRAQTETTKTLGQFLHISNSQFLYDNRPFYVKGFNYYPRDHAWRIFRDWDKDEVDHELQLGSGSNANSVRTFINYQHSTDNVDYQYDWRTNFHVSENYLENIEAFLTLADKNRLKVILSLFDYAYWELFRANGHSVGEAYLAELIPRFANDSRILAWDVINEPDLNSGLIGAVGEQNVIGFLQRMSNKIRELDSNHPITIGLGDPSYATKVQSLVDFVCFHHYAEPNGLYSEIRALRKIAKPIVVEEFGKHTWSQDPQDPSNEMLQKQYYASVLNIVRNQNISGSMFWTLMDFPVEDNPCKYMCFPVDKGENKENHFGIYRTDYSPKPARDIVKQYYSQ